MSDLTLRERFPIDPRQVSRRLFFAKTGELETVWHLCDASLGRALPDGKGVEFVALHGKYIYPVVQCDTVLQADLRRGLTDGLCARCMREFHLAVDLICQKRLLKFE